MARGSSSREEVPVFLSSLKRACRRPLYSEVGLSHSRWREPKDSDPSSEEKTWEELLIAATGMMDVLSEHEHGQVLRIASIFLLGYLLPYSTGCDYNLLQYTDRYRFPVFDVERAILEMPLLERMQRSVRYVSVPHEGRLTDPALEVAFDSFLCNGLEPLLAARKYHFKEVDLLHIIAMAIHPQPQFRSELEEHSTASLQKAQQLTKNFQVATQFQIQYRHRVRMIRMLIRALVMPQVQDDDIGDPLLFGAVPHLQASLREFAHGAQTQRDAHLSLVCLVTLSVQTENRRVVEEVFEFLLHRMVDDNTEYGTTSFAKRSIPAWTKMAIVDVSPKGFCPHTAKGELLAALLCRACSRDKPESVHAFATSLADLIEWQEDECTISEDDGENKTGKKHSAPMFASLLFAAKHIFLFQPSRSPGDDEDPREVLVRCGVNLLQHPDRGISSEAAGLLVFAFTYDKQITIVNHAQDILTTLCTRLPEGNFRSSSIMDLVAVCSLKVPALALTLFDKLNEYQSGGNIPTWILPVLSIICHNCPSVADRRLNSLKDLWSSQLCEEEAFSLVSALMSSRMSRFFVGDEPDDNAKAVAGFLSSFNFSYWSRYQLVRNAFVAGNFEICIGLLSQIQNVPLSERNYLWISALRKLAQGEAVLANKGSIAIPEAEQSIRAALSSVRNMNKLSSKKEIQFYFQEAFLMARLDFLDLVVGLRQLTQEMRLTSAPPVTHTRSRSHLSSLIRSFEALGVRFKRMACQYSLNFQHQSRASLRLWQGMSFFLAVAAGDIFAGAVPTGKRNMSLDFLAKYKDPCAILLCQLDEGVLQRMDTSLDPHVRAAAMHEILDAMLMVPAPFPRDFFVPSMATTSGCFLELLPDPEEVNRNALLARPLLSCSLQVKGSIPTSFNHLRVPVWQAMVKLRMEYVGPLMDDDGVLPEREDSKDDDKNDLIVPVVQPVLPDLSLVSPVSSLISSGGFFHSDIDLPPFSEEGRYRLQATLGCKDASGRFWESPHSFSSVEIKVSRSLQ